MRKTLFIATLLCSWLSFASTYAQNVAKIGSEEYATLKAAVAAADAGATITLLADDNSLSDGSEITINKSLTITGAVDGQGNPLYTIYGKSSETGYNDIFITGSGTVTISNVKVKNFGNNAATNIGHAPIYVSKDFTGTVNLTNVYVSNFNRGGMFLYGGTFNVDGCYIDCANSTSGAFTKGIEIKNTASGTIQHTYICNMERSSATYSSAGIEIYGSGSIVVDDCTIESNNGTHSTAKATFGIVAAPVGAYDPSGGSLQVTECVFTCTNGCLSIEANNYDAVLDDCSFDNYIATFAATTAVTINSGDYAEDVYADAGSIIIHGGEFTNFAPDTDTGSIIIDGGTFDADPTAYLAEGVALIDNGDGTYTVKNYVAQIGETKYTSLAEAVAAVPADGTATTITMIADETINNNAGVTIAAGKNIVLDLNGKTISQTGVMAMASYLIKNNGTLTIKDNTDINKNGTGDGKMQCSAEFPDTGEIPNYATNLINNYGNLTIESGYYQTLTEEGFASYVVDNYPGGTANITGGKLCNVAEYEYVVRMFCNSQTNTNTVNVSGGVIEGGYALWLQVPGSAAAKASLVISGGTFISRDGGSFIGYDKSGSRENISVDISGGTFNGNPNGLVIQGINDGVNDFGHLSISGGDFTGIAAGGNLAGFISGGTFDTPVNEAYCAEGYIPTDLGNGKYGVKAGSYVAQIGDTKYETLQAAIAAAEADATVTLLDNIDLGTESLTINKALTLTGNYTITSSAAQAILLTGSGAFNLTNVAVVATNGHGIQAGTDENAYTGALALTNSTLTVAKRGINVWSVSEGFALNVNGSTIQSNVADPTTDFSAGNDARGINLIGSGYTVTLTNTTVQGFAYNVNVPTSGTGLNVNINGGTYNGWSFINNWGSNNTFNVEGATANSQGLTGYTNAFSIIVDNEGAQNNSYTIKDCSFTVTPKANGEHQDFIDLRGTNATVKVLGSTTYTTTDDELSDFIANEGGIFTNNLYFDVTTAATFADAFEEAVISTTPTTIQTEQLYSVNYTPEVYYYWVTASGNVGGYYHFAEPFTNGYIDNGEFIQLMKDVTLTANVACQLTSGSFTLTQGAFAVTKGEYAVTLKNGVSVVTDKQTDIFAAADAANYTISETEDNGTYTYTVVEKTFVAQIGDVKYESLAAAVAAVPTDGTETTITMIADETVSVTGYAITIAANQNVILDLNGHQVVGTCETSGTSALIRNLGTLTIQDSSDTNADGTGDGKIIAGADPTWTWDGTDNYAGSYASNLIRNEGDLTINSGLLLNVSSGSAAYAIDNYGAGNVTINGGKVDAKKASAIRMFYVNRGSISVTGGVIGHYNSDDDYSYMGIQVMGGSYVDVTVTGGTIVGYFALYAGNSGGEIAISSDGTFDGYVGIGEEVQNVTISGGTFYEWVGTYGTQTGFISGGTYYEAPDEEYLAEGYILTDLGNGTYGVVQGSYVAQIGSTKYTSLAAAIAAVPTDGTETTIKMIDNEIVAAGTTMTIAAGKNIVLDLNGKTITGSSTTSAPNFYFITNKGILEITDNSDNASGKITYVCSSATYSNEYVTICNEGGTFTLTKGTVENTGGGLSYAVNNRSVAPGTATFNLNGGTISAPSGDAALRVYQSIYNSNSPYANKVNIAGGTILDTGIFVDTYISSSLADGNNAQIAINISEGTVNGLIDLKIRHPFNTLLNITGGNFTNTKMWVRKFASEYVAAYGEPTAPMVTISGGKFDFATNNAFGLAYDYAATTWTSYAKPYAISGGVFELAVPAEYCAEGYVPAENTDATTSQAYPYTVELPMSERDIELVDGQPYTFAVNTQVKSVTYVRTLGENNVDKYLSWYVPFNYTITTDDAENFTFYKISMIANSPDPKENSDPDKIWIFLTEMSAGETLKANKPYIFKSKTSGEFTFTTQSATLYAPATDPRMETSTSLCEFAFYGTYASKSLQGTNIYYMGSKGALSRAVAAPQTIRSYRWYIEATPKDEDYAPVFVFAEEDDDATGIKLAGNAQTEESYYNLNGMKINKPASGVYIIKYSDGSVKKVAVK